ncbi:MAG: SpaH/EbpB family LPXTG-anchored major pilin [Aristaeellaceae bacterium]
MNKTRTLISTLLALMLCMCMIVPAMATQEGTLTGGSITINDAVPGQIYNAYQLLYLESYNADSGAYAYKANSAWETWLKTQTAYVSFDAQGYVTWVDGADAAAFAKLAQVEAAKMTADATATAPAAAEGATYSTVKFENLKLGYYLVDTTLGTLCSLDTTNPNVVMEEKNQAPANVKTVEEDSTGNYGETNDADIGQTVNFKSTITAQAGAENYVFHDTMSAGLTYTGVTGITLNGAAVAASNYTVVTEGLTDNCTFEVVFTQAFCDTLKANDQIVISYTATVNENAVIAGEGNPNASKLSYGDSSTATSNVTPPSETITYTWDLDVLKYANGDESAVLADAKFVLLNSAKTKVATIVGGKVTGWADVPTAADDGSITWPASTVLTTGANGKIEIDGLDADTYYLREVQAPAGYNKLAEDVKVVITGATTVDGELTYTTVVAKVNNQSGTELPSTGGIGTTVFYVVGGLLVVGAFILLVSKRRVSAEK